MSPTFRRVIAYTIATSVVLTILNGFGLVGFSYLRRVENNPLASSIRVSKATENQILLEDGRRIDLDFWRTDALGWESTLRESRSIVEIDEQKSGTVDVYGLRNRFYCGMSMPPIRLPIFPTDVPKYERWLIAIGRMAEK